jgi:UDP-N-acetyl-2-amino-2-deoxyglucuronate dehydrogenase
MTGGVPSGRKGRIKMLHFAIVGCGHIAEKHAKAIAATRGARLAAVCDTNPDRLRPYRSRGINGYRNLTDLLRNEEIDVVNICAPSGYHAELAVEAAQAGKHIIVEKPMALTLEDADRIIEACDQNNVKLSVVHPNRFRPAVMELKKAVDTGRFGKLSHANATVRWNRNQAYYDKDAWRGTKSLDGGVLMNQAVHILDLLIWLMGDVEEVSGFYATRLRHIEAEDVAVGIVRFASGALGVVEAAVTVFPRNLEESIALFGDTGTVKIGGATVGRIEFWQFKDAGEDEANEWNHRADHDPGEKTGHQWIVEDMVQAVKENRTPAVTGRDGRNVLELIIAIHKAAATNTVVQLKPAEVF